MPKQARPARSASLLPKRALERFAQRIDSASDFSITGFARPASAGHSSSTIWISEPSRRWISIARSGDRNSAWPSICDWKRTPSSLILRRDASDITWKPPESVRIGRCQFMNLCRPPSRATRSAPGRSIR